MFCDGCGQALQSGQAFCSKCGKQIVGQIGAVQSLAMAGRVKQHVHLLGILWFAFSALNGLLGLFFVLLGSILFPHLREMKDVPPDVPVGFISALFTTIGILILARPHADSLPVRG